MVPLRPGFAFLSSFLTMFALGSLYAWSVFLLPLERQFAASRATASAIFSVATACFTVAMLFGPSLYRRASPAVLVFATFLLAAAGMLLCSVATGVWQIAIGYGGLFGAANGVGYGIALQSVQNAMRTRRGLMTGIVIAGYTAGSAVLAPLLSHSIAAIGSRGTFEAMAGGFTIVGLVAAFLLRRSGVALASIAAGRSGPEPAPAPHWLPVLWICFLLGSAAGLLTLGHAATIVAAAGGTDWLVAMAASLVAVGNGAGRIVGGWLGDRAAPRALLLGTQSLSGLALVAAALWPSASIAFVGIGLVGLGYGCLAGGYPVTVAHLFGRERVARVYGRIFTAWGVAAVLAPYVGGVLFDWTGGYGASFFICGGLALLAALLGLALRAGAPRR